MEIQIMALQETGNGHEQARTIERAVNSKYYKAYANPNKGGLAIIIHQKKMYTGQGYKQTKRGSLLNCSYGQHQQKGTKTERELHCITYIWRQEHQSQMKTRYLEDSKGKTNAKEKAQKKYA